MAFIRNLINPEQATFVWNHIYPKIKAHLLNGGTLRFTVEKMKKSRDQEEMYHAMISQIAKEAQHLGATWDAESWKRLLVDKYCKEVGIDTGRIIPNLDKDGIVQLGMQTRNFTKEQGSEFIEWLYSWAANAGIKL